MSAPDREALSPAQHAALAAVRARGGRPDGALAEVVEAIGDHAYVTLNFHPYRRLADGRSVAQGLLDDGVYRGQFETKISNGSATAFPGGLRYGWEDSLFSGAYRDSSSADRPKYGALALMRHADGAAPRFGCCYIRLRRELTDRCTFTWGDSHLGPEHIGTADALWSVARALFDQVSSTGAALGIEGLDAVALTRRLLQDLPTAPPEDPADHPVGRSLDDYIEAQVHGPINLGDHVEALVVDATLRDSDTGRLLEQVAATHGISLRFHPGFRLATAAIPDDFRGPRIPELARRLNPAEIDATVLAEAAHSMQAEPMNWRDWASPEEALQHLKQLWHCLVAFGRPPTPSAMAPECADR